MIELLDHIDSDRVVGFRVNGRIRAEDFDRVVRVIEDRLRLLTPLRIYAEIEDIGGMSLRTFLKDVTFSFKHLRDFDKEAVVSDKQWIAKYVKIADRLFPSIEARAFSMDDRENALEWVSG